MTEDDLPDNVMMAVDMDAAIVGYTFREVNDESVPVVVYSIEKVINIIQERDGLGYEDAEEFFFFNLANADVGERTPIYIHTKPEILH